MDRDNPASATEEVLEEVEIETYGKAGKRPPKARRYRVRIDKALFVFEQEIVTGRELLEKAGKIPVESFKIHQKLHGGQMVEIGYDEKVDLRKPGIERFVTMEKQQTEGRGIRQSFCLPEDDVAYLDSLGLQWETIQDGNARWLLIHDHPVPPGYNQGQVTLAVRIEGGYPPVKLDMAYFHPALQRQNGKIINALSNQSIGGVNFQRWSRHYGWREGLDNLGTHHLRIKQWLQDELAK